MDETHSLERLQECLHYAQGNLDWLATSQAGSYLSQVSNFSDDSLDQTMTTFDALLQNRTLHYLHNKRVPINRIPSEIFRYILLYLKDHLMPFPVPIGGSLVCTPPTTGTWHRASLVCRHWRQEVLEIPELWTTIRVSDDTDSAYRWNISWLARSGVLPLSILFDTHLTHWRHRRSQDILCILAEGHRIHALYFYRSITPRDLNPILIGVADRLETLFLIGDQPSFGPQPSLDRVSCTLPQLQVLSVANSLVWRKLRMGALRHLSLASSQDQEWDVEDLHDFLSILADNPHLEELMIYKVAVHLEAMHEMHALTGRSSPIPLPKLQKLFIDQTFSVFELHAMAEILASALSLPPSCTRFYIPHCPSPHAAYPVQRLAAVSGSLIGADGRSTCVMERGENKSCRMPIDCAQVQELYLRWSPRITPVYVPRPGEPAHTYSSAITSIWSMHSVVLLVVELDIPFWLDSLVNSLPLLKELSILTHRDEDRQAILRFLARRRQNGLKVSTLRLVGDPTLEDCKAFNTWRADPSEFRRHTDQVIFEEVNACSDSMVRWQDFISESIPEVCKHPSPTSAVWQPWFTYL